jgi:hypothetical protein
LSLFVLTFDVGGHGGGGGDISNYLWGLGSCRDNSFKLFSALMFLFLKCKLWMP